MLERIADSAGNLFESSRALTSASHQNATSAGEQAANTNQIVQTMEEVDSHSTEIGSQARGVEDAAQRMKAEIDDGNTSAGQIIAKMEEVRRSNTATIEQVQILNEHITDIWEVVRIINDIARKIRIIAFNATLQASAAGRAGKSFEVVANEIRRLAESTVASTSEITSRVEEIQSAADALIQTSQDDTDREDQRSMDPYERTGIDLQVASKAVRRLP